jgi:hypothetical protein
MMYRFAILTTRRVIDLETNIYHPVILSHQLSNQMCNAASDGTITVSAPTVDTEPMNTVLVTEFGCSAEASLACSFYL